jgi:3-dehydroquinate dehydratase-2
MEKILLLQGANMSYLGRRQPELYGTTTAAEVDQILLAHANTNGYQLDIYYTHIEGEAISRLYRSVEEGVQGLVMNPAGFNYAGYALRDCVVTLPFPYVEVHMTNIEKRGIHSVLAPAAVGSVCGFGVHSYVLGLEAMLKLLRK